LKLAGLLHHNSFGELAFAVAAHGGEPRPCFSSSFEVELHFGAFDGFAAFAESDFAADFDLTLSVWFANFQGDLAGGCLSFDCWQCQTGSSRYGLISHRLVEKPFKIGSNYLLGSQPR
jgi:hypothetical protein